MIIMLIMMITIFYDNLSYPTCTILSYPILSYPILSYPILSYPILSYPILFYPILFQSIHGKSFFFSFHATRCPAAGLNCNFYGQNIHLNSFQ